MSNANSNDTRPWQRLPKWLNITLWVALVVIVVIPILGSVITNVFLASKEQGQGQPPAITQADREEIRSAYIENCTASGGSESYCACVAGNLANNLTHEVLVELASLDSATDEQVDAFNARYILGCS
jgi:hypothetical protein